MARASVCSLLWLPLGHRHGLPVELGPAIAPADERMPEKALRVSLGRFWHLDRRVRERPLGCMTARTFAEGDRLHERVPTETVCTVHGDARHLAGRIQARELGLAPHVGIDATHVVVRARSD